MLNHFKEVDIAGKVTIKQKLLDIVCPSMTSMLPPVSKIKMKGAPKSHLSKNSTKRDPLYFEHVESKVNLLSRCRWSSSPNSTSSFTLFLFCCITSYL